jgi:ketosteroid isomerase-like protein
MVLATEKRNQLVEAYFDALDEEEYEELPGLFTEDATYVHPSATVEGGEGIRRLFAENRRTETTDHQITRRVHGTDATVCEGTVTGEFIDGDAFNGEFMDAFEFDEESERIAVISVYTRNVY